MRLFQVHSRPVMFALLALVVCQSLVPGLAATSKAAATASVGGRRLRQAATPAVVPPAPATPADVPPAPVTPAVTAAAPGAVVPPGPIVLPGPLVPAGQPNATDLAVEALNVTKAGPQPAMVSTIFAPTDAAFKSLATALNLTSPLDLFNATLNATTANITALHVIPGELVTAANWTATPVVTAPTLSGYKLTITREPNGNVTVTVPGSDVVATVLNADVPFNGSIVQVIDKVLLPPANVSATWPVPLPNITAATPTPP